MEAAHYEQSALWGAEHVFTPEHQLPKFAAVRDLLETIAPESIVDVGAGDGRVLHSLTEAGVSGRQFAAERSRAALVNVGADVARTQASIDHLPFADRSFAAAICCEVLEHLPSTVFADALAELARVARDHIIVTVPNREKRSRSDISCAVCGCRYNPDRHLRSFAPDELPALLPGFAVDRVIETGPHQPVYPRWVRLLLERAGLLQRPGAPSCPQCGATYRFAVGDGSRSPTKIPMDETTNGARRGRRSYDLARRIVPKARRPYYLCARFRRVR